MTSFLENFRYTALHMALQWGESQGKKPSEIIAAAQVFLAFLNAKEEIISDADAATLGSIVGASVRDLVTRNAEDK